MINEKEIIINELTNPGLNDWRRISQHKYLTEEFMEKYKDKIDWGIVSICQRLSESFIEKYQDKVDWVYINIHQELSKEFKDKHKEKLATFARPSLHDLNLNVNAITFKQSVSYRKQK